MASERRSSVESKIREMAAKDEKFRSELVSNPRGALEKLFGGKLPEDTKIHIHEETPNSVHIVLSPQETANKSVDLSTCYNSNSGGSWCSCGYELSCYGPTCC
jgi:hypothetical protein